MSLRRIWGAFMRYFYMFIRLDHLSDLLYWPALDLFLWGMATVWIQDHSAAVPGYALAILTGLVFWQIVLRGNYEMTVNMLQEFWNRNLVNLFATPLRIGEWLIAMSLLSICKILISLFFGALLVYLLYAMNIFQLGWAFLPFAFSLCLSGWFIGLFFAGFIIYWGQRVQSLAWMSCYALAPFSAVYYPLEALPAWGQAIAKSLPTTYIFEGMRKVLIQGVFDAQDFAISIALNIGYLIAGFYFFLYMFEKSRKKGLGRLE